MNLLQEEISRLQRLIKSDEKRMFEESAWGKQAIQHILRLEEIKSYLEEQSEAGGDRRVIKRALQYMTIELDEKEQAVLKMATMFHQTEAEVQHNDQELYFLNKYIGNLKSQIAFCDDLNISSIKEIDEKRQVASSLISELRHVQSVLNKIQMMNERLQKNVKEFTNEINKQMAFKNKLENQLEKEENTHQQVEKKMQHTLDELHNKSRDLASLEIQAMQARKSVEKAEEAHKHLGGQKKTLTNDARNVTSTSTLLKDYFAKDKSELLNLTSENERMKADLSIKLHQVETLKNEQAELIKNIKEEKKKSSSLREELANQEGSVNSLVKVLNDAKLDLNSQFEQKEILQTLVADLKRENNCRMQEHKHLSGQLKEREVIAMEVQESCNIKTESMKNVIALQKNNRDQLLKAYHNELELAREEANNIYNMIKKKENEINSFSQALREFQEIFMYTFFKTTNMKKH